MSPFFWVVLASTALSGFFSLTGVSLRVFRRVQLEQAFAGPRGEKRLKTLEEHLHQLQLTTSLGRAVTNLVLVVAMVYLFEAAQHGWGRVVGAAATAAGLVAVFGVAIPNAWASCAGEKVLAATLEVLMGCMYTMRPVIVILQAFDLPIRRLSGAAENVENGDAAKQEILHAASEGQAEGAVDAEEVEMIESVIEFGRTQAGEIMTPRTDLLALPAEIAWEDARRRVVQAGHTRVPVYDGNMDNIVGILYAKDLLKYVGSAEPPLVRSLMRKPFFVPETKALDDLLREFKARRFHIAIVLDEYGGTAGVVTIEDVLEEIVGEISDEYDHATPPLMNRVDEKTAEVDGRMHIDDLNDALGLKIPEDEDFDTVAGFVFSELGYIPKVGEKLQAYGAEFAVIASDERKITKLRVERLEKEQAEQQP